MSHPAQHEQQAAEDDFILRPRPRRPFELSSLSSSAPDTPPLDGRQPFPTYDPSTMASTSDSTTTTVPPETPTSLARTPSRTKSFVDLTKAPLSGIYGSDTGNPTPWGTGAQTPAEGALNSYDFSRLNLPGSAMYEKGRDGKMWRRDPKSQLHRHVQPTGFRGYWVPLAGRTLILFVVGMLYGVLISHLYAKQKLAPVTVNIDREGWPYFALWGGIAAALGNALPWADSIWAPNDDGATYEQKEAKRQRKDNEGGLDAFMDAARSIGAFVGVAFAIRRLPWQSTLQLSLTLALANPAVWYLIDRTPPGFILSAVVAFSGTAALLGIDPGLVPSPSPWEVMQAHMGNTNQTFDIPRSEDLVLGVFSEELVGVATWIASVLFISCVCFGNIGRRLLPRNS